MGCVIEDLPKEYVANAIRNQEVIAYIHPGMDYKQIAQVIRNLSPIIDNYFEVKNEEGKVIKVQVGVDENSVFKDRVSDRNNRSGKSKPKDKNYHTISGDQIHAALHDLLQTIYDGGDVTEVYARHAGPINKEVFKELVTIAKDRIYEATMHQNMINKQLGTNDKFEMLLEQRIGSGPRSIAGKIDVLFLFSNKTGMIYDYKSYEGKKTYAQLADQYQGQLIDYKRILKEDYGIDEIVKALVVPIKVKFINVSEDKKTATIHSITGYETDEKETIVKAINNSYDKLGIAGVDKFLKTQHDKIRKLEDKIRLEKKQEVKDKLVAEVADLKNSIKQFTSSGDFNFIVDHILKIVIPEIETQLRKETFDEMEPQEALALINQYTDTLKDYVDTLKYFTLEDIQQQLGLTNNSEQLFDIVAGLEKRSKIILNRLREVNLRIAGAEIDSSYIDESTGQFKPFAPVKAISRLFTRLNRIDNPLIKAFYKKSRESSEAKSVELRQFLNKLTDIQNQMEVKLKEVGRSFKEVFIENGNYLDNLSEEGKEIRNQQWAIANKDKKTEKLVGDHPDAPYVFREEEFKADYERRLLKFEANTRLKHGSNEEQVQKDLVNWELDNNILKYDHAFFKSAGRNKWIKPKPEFQAKYLNPKLEYILSIPEFKAWLDFKNEYTNDFREMLGMHYGDMPDNFYPNVRKTIVDKFLENPTQLGKLWDSFTASFTLREDDVFLGTYANGEPVKEVPKFFISKLADDEKSYNYAESLALFAKMAINYKHASDLEIYANSIREVLTDSVKELVLDDNGNPRIDYAGDKVVKSAQELVNLFNTHVDYLVYGITTTNIGNIPGTNVNATKVIKAAMKWTRLSALGLRINTALGAFGASRIAINAIKKKESYFTTEQFDKSVKDRVSNRQKWLTITSILDATNEDLVSRASGKHFIKGIRKLVDSRMMFSPFRVGDQFHKDDMAYAMSLNYGLNAEGQLRRLINLPEGTKSLADSLDLETGQLEGKSLEESMRILESFRTITKQAFYRVTGSINEDNIYAAQTSLLWQNLMMFKSWMPGVVGERVGKITYDEITDTLDMPRYTALTKWIAPKGQRNLKKIISRAGLLSIDIMTYGIAKKALYKDGKRVNNELSEAQFKAWKYKNPVAAENVTKEEFERMQEGQMRAAVFELRAILSFFAVVLLLGSDDEDDFYSHKNNYAMRQANKILNKSLSELTYFWTPTSISDLLARPIGLLSLGQNITGVVTNGFDEGYDIITGQNSKGQDMTDRTPPGYYSTKLIVGLNGLRSTVDWIFSEDKKVR